MTRNVYVINFSMDCCKCGRTMNYWETQSNKPVREVSFSQCMSFYSFCAGCQIEYRFARTVASRVLGGPAKREDFDLFIIDVGESGKWRLATINEHPHYATRRRWLT
jgi:hypothetical protein